MHAMFSFSPLNFSSRSSRSYVWFNTSEFKKTSLANRLVHLTLMALVYVAYILVVYHTVSNPVTQENLIDVCMNIGMFVGGSTCWIRFILNWRNREKITNVVASINDKVQLAKEECNPAMLENWRYNYWMLFRVAAIAYAMAFALSVVVLVYPILSGNHILVMWTSEFHSLSWWGHVALASTITLYCSTYYNLSDVQAMDCVLQLAFLYRVEYEKIPRISTNEESARTQIINLYKELLSLKMLTTDYLEVVRFHKMYLWTISYIALAVLCVAFIISTDDGFLSRSRLVLYPLYFLCLLAVWGLAGTHFEESVRTSVICPEQDIL